MVCDTLAIVGVGLLGGSLGLAAKSRHLARRVIGIGRSVDRLIEARELHAIDEFTTSISEGVANADFVIFCTPVDQIVRQILDHANAFAPNAVLTDVGSTKREIVEQLECANLGTARFVGSHPMAGSEKKGALYATADLFKNRVTIITPTAATNANALGTVRSWWEAVGSKVIELTPENHDRAVAFVSHLPHVVATALAASVSMDDLPIAAGGFRDTTRVAAAGPTIWEPIFRANREQVLGACRAFQAQFQEFYQLLEADDAQGLIDWLAEGKRVRDALGS